MESTPKKPNRAVFLDRDGTLVHSFQGRTPNCAGELRLINTVPAGLQLLHDAGFKLVMVSNQGGIGLGYTTMAKMSAMNLRLRDLIIASGGPPLDAFYWCGHPPKNDCAWRKPNPGMLLAASRNSSISLEKSYIVGDQTVDVSAGRQAQLKACISVSSGNAVKNQVWKYSDFHAPNFLRAAEAILAMEES